MRLLGVAWRSRWTRQCVDDDGHQGSENMFSSYLRGGVLHRKVCIYYECR
jgi:hypothetical protein